MILCIGTTPAAQRVMVFRKFTLDVVNRAANTLDGVAGKSVNVAKVLKALGESVVATGFVGGPRGESVRSVLRERGIELELIDVPAPTRQCLTIVDEATGQITELVEEGRPVEPSSYEELETIVRRRVQACTAVVMSGTLTAGGPTDFYARCTRLAHQAGALSILDAQGPALLEALKERPGLVKPNRPELAATVGHELRDESAVLAAMADLAQRGAQRVVVTAGKDPALAFDGHCCWRVRAPRLAAMNPIGSGDAFTAGLTWRLVRGENLGEACRWGAAAGAANALTLMAGEIDPRETACLASGVVVESICSM